MSPRTPNRSPRLFESLANQLKQVELSTPVRRRHCAIVRRCRSRNDQGVDDSAPPPGHPMQVLPSRPRLDQIALKWHDLAQRRLDYYTELSVSYTHLRAHETGRNLV